MLQRHQIKEELGQGSKEIESLRTRYLNAMSRLLADWDPVDHWLVRIGFGAFLLSALVRLLGMLLMDQ